MSQQPPAPPKTRWTGAAAGGAAGFLALALYLLFWPVGVEPEPWRPPEAPSLEALLAPGRRLSPVERLDLDGASGPEAVAVDGRGRIYTGTRDGRILRLEPGPGDARIRTFARTGGRPMGLAFDRGGRLLVADLERGLLAVGRDGAVEVLAESAGGRTLGRTNGVAVGPDGTIYFTDASWAHPDAPALVPLVAHRPTGRLLAHDPETGRTRVLLDSLRFANGVAVDPGGGFLLISETAAYRVRRVDL
ncbi:MAG TPA: SMP-30/gluconolactonase/LRE family protein, partial [Longimicrobiales bacterium]|nr:SMP-30/gluconolactonase/LRE family protein [Longimicrobiales bacterium]